MLLAAALAALVVFPGSAFGATFTVTSTGDTGDSNTADGVCNDGSGGCTLRAAIQQANAAAGADAIHFSIGVGVKTIKPGSPLPAVAAGTTINGTTQPGFAGTPIIELDGSAAGAAHGVVASGPGTTIRGLVINRFSGFGAELSGGVAFKGNYVGTDFAGLLDVGNSQGVWTSGDGNTIGGTTSFDRNLISGNDDYGVQLHSRNNLVLGNFIGVDATGAKALANTAGGVRVLGWFNEIGDTAAGAANVISGNGLGILLNAEGATVEGNYIGTDASGGAAVGNATAGILAFGGLAHVHTIGGTVAGARNVISGNGSAGILLRLATGTKVQGNHIGTDASGTGLVPNAIGLVLEGSNGATIGGLLTAAANRIAFNTGAGVRIQLFGSFGAKGNSILGNSIFGNGSLGIDLGSDGVTANDAGDGDTGANDLQNFPVLTTAFPGSSSTEVAGTLNSKASGTYRIELFVNDVCDPSGHGEGKTSLGATNVTTDASDNAAFSVSVTAVPQGDFITATATDSANNTSEFSACAKVEPATFIVTSIGDGGDANTGDGVCATAGDGPCTLRAAIQQANASFGANKIHFNIPGVAPHTISPASALPTVTDPVTIDATTEPDFAGSPVVELDGSNAPSQGGIFPNGLTIGGGNTTVRGLVINRFAGAGIWLDFGGGNVLQGNFVGTDVNGAVARPNAFQGIVVGSSNNTVGGTSTGDRNVISGNTQVGIRLILGTGNIVQGNYIGTNAAGTGALGNGASGVLVTSNDNTIGGAVAAARNVISANGQQGIHFSAGSTGNAVQGNYIGTNAAGTGALGNAFYGVAVFSSPANTVGGTTPAARNVLSGNGRAGVLLSGPGATGNLVQGNYVGVGADGATAVPNAASGVLIDNGARGNTIGGTASGAGNLIAHNGTISFLNGGVVAWMAGNGNAILGNSIHSNNAGLGIDLSNNPFGQDGVTPNDAGDGDTGSNDLQNFPVLTTASPGSSSTGVAGTLNSKPSGSYRIELFGNDVCDPSGHGEGKSFLDATNVTTDAGGNASFAVSLPTVPLGHYITATARDAANNTSEFSACKKVEVATFVVTSTGDGGDANTGDGVCATVAGGPCTLRAAIQQANASFGANKIHFNIPPSGTKTISPDSALPTITDPVTIDGTTQPGFSGSPIIELDGSSAPSPGSIFVNGLTISAGNTTVRGLVINRFAGVGIFVDGGSGNVIEGNYIGTNVAGTADLGNSFDGVVLFGSSSNTIGGATAPKRNVISGNNSDGVSIVGVSTGNVVEGNYIGTTATGGAALGNSDDGVFGGGSGSGVTGNTIRGNVISGNSDDGVRLNGAATTGNLVQGNSIGTDSTGTVDLGNGQEGVFLDGGTSGNTIVGNVISGNQLDGILLSAAGSGNQIKGNKIGTTAAGTGDLGNTHNGIRIVGGSGTIVGGTAAGAANVISGNDANGVAVLASTGNAIQRNSIFANTGLGIDLGLGGVTANDPGDTDTGANELQNFPVLTSAVTAGGVTTIEGTLNSTPATAFTIEFFANGACDPSNHGEGQSFRGSTTVTTGPTGDASFVFVATSPIAAGEFVTATATDSAGTSEFSKCLEVKTAAQAITDLSGAVTGLALHQGTENSLLAKLNAALAALAAGDTKTACNNLDAFINEVQAQSGKKIPAPDAAALIKLAEEIKTALGC